ncbi:MAG: energy-coupling factor ABC transporter permease [Hespellia sp.]|nr:energy-coupling factor ABC transporter permease [Hespellia sp.]
MHMADALISPAVGGSMYALSAVAAGYSIKKIHLEADPKKVPVMGVMGAFVFAAQMINFTIPGTGSSGHLCGGMLLTALLGPYAAFLTMIGVLLIQCLMFADGGLLALGANVWNMAFYGCFIGYLIWRAMNGRTMSRGRIIGASVIGSVLTLQLGAFSVSIETLLSGITDLPFSVFIGMMQPIHLAIGMVEGLITAAVLVFVYEARPEMLSLAEAGEKKERFSARKTIGILAVIALFIGGGLSLFASSHPDGLEWSIEKVTGSTELEAAENSIYRQAESVQEKTALLPDYQFKNTESGLGTSFSGILGSCLVLVVCGGVCYVISRNHKKKGLS